MFGQIDDNNEAKILFLIEIIVFLICVIIGIKFL